MQTMDGPSHTLIPTWDWEWEVEAIIGHRWRLNMHNLVEQYLVKWKGWPASSWEHIDNLTNCEELINAYDATLPAWGLKD